MLSTGSTEREAAVEETTGDETAGGIESEETAETGTSRRKGGVPEKLWRRIGDRAASSPKK